MQAQKQISIALQCALVGTLVFTPLVCASDKYPDISDDLASGRGVWLGNPELKDSEAKSAVNYMLALAKFYLSIKEK